MIQNVSEVQCLPQAYNEAGEKKKIFGPQERDIKGLDTDLPPHTKKEKALVFAAEQLRYWSGKLLRLARSLQ